MGGSPQLYDPDAYTGRSTGASSGIAAGSAALKGVSSYNNASGGKLTKKLRSLLSGSGGGGDSSVASPSPDETALNPNFKRGGLVRKTGNARVHKGEFVLTASQVKNLRRAKKRKSERGAHR